MAGGAPIPLFAPKAGAYRLVAETRPHMGADVFVVRYPTTDVTGLDGEFEVMNIPTGSVTVTAFSPAIGIRSRVTQEILIKEGEVVDLPLVLRFSEADYQKTQAPAATPNRSTTGSP